MTLNEFIEKYKSDNFESYVIENATIDYWNELIKTYKLEKLKFVFPEAMFLKINYEIKEGKSLLGKEFDEFCEKQIKKLKIEKQSKININQKENINVESFFENIENYTGFERKKIVSNLTNNFDLNLLTELSNSFVQYCFLKFNKINYSLPTIERPEKKEGDISLNEFHFPFYDFIQNEIQKEVRIETFNNISFNDCLKFNSYMNTFLDEIENIIENQNIKINGIKVTTEATTTEKATTTESKVLGFSLNDWNEKTFNLFNYLIDNYHTKGKVKYTNIFRFLKNIEKTNYAFNFTEVRYKEYILKNYGEKITTFKPANYKYEDKEQPILNGFEYEFRKQSMN
jgi:small nuclear ribonucleoprotein (snRNP)-like protein